MYLIYVSSLFKKWVIEHHKYDKELVCLMDTIDGYNVQMVLKAEVLFGKVKTDNHEFKLQLAGEEKHEIYKENKENIKKVLSLLTPKKEIKKWGDLSHAAKNVLERCWWDDKLCKFETFIGDELYGFPVTEETYQEMVEYQTHYPRYNIKRIEDSIIVNGTVPL